MCRCVGLASSIFVGSANELALSIRSATGKSSQALESKPSELESKLKDLQRD
jgi:hypothetical protein